MSMLSTLLLHTRNIFLDLTLVSVLFTAFACNQQQENEAFSKAEIVKDDAEPDNTLFWGPVEDQPEPTAGMGAFYEYVDATLTYPEEAKADSIEGKVFVQFLVTEEGQITEVETIKGIGYGCDEEAERIMRHANSWKPGKERGNPVEVRMVLPITFRLNHKEAK